MSDRQLHFDADTADLLALLVECAGEAHYLWDIAGDRLAWSANAGRVLGLNARDLPASQQELRARLGPDDAPARALAISCHLDHRVPLRCEYKFRRADGVFEWIEERGVADFAGDGGARRLLGRLRVISERKRQEGELEKRAWSDELTGLLNRGRVAATLDAAIAYGRAGSHQAAYLLINVDRLSVLNTAYGHEVGDAILREVAHRLEGCLRVGDVIGRVGGNQFGVVLLDCDETRMELFAGQALARVRGNEIETGSGPIMATVSMGGVGGGHFAGDSHTVMGRAEEALALAKMGGRDRFASYDRLSDRAAARREALSTANTVQRALRDRRLVLAVEPVVAGPDGSIHFHECLLRMLDDDGRAVPASQFMPAVEELGLVRKVDRHVVSLALTELAAHPELRLSVNISAMTATDASLFGVILSMIESQPEAAARLIVEITETVAMHEFDSTASFIGRLHELGCQVAIDDFGAGFTSFRHLKNLQIDMVKIDSQFIRGLPESAENRLFVEAFLELARSMDVRVVAECVETEAEAAFLRGRGVDYLQGYWFGRPTLERPWGSAPCSAATG